MSRTGRIGRMLPAGVSWVWLFAALCFLSLLMVGKGVTAGVADLALAAPSVDLTPYFAPIDSETPELTLPMPPGAGSGEAFTLKATGPSPHYVWLVGQVANRSNALQDDVVEISAPGFVGSRLFWPLPLGSGSAAASASDQVALAPMPASDGRAWQIQLAPGKAGLVAIETDSLGPATAVTLWKRPAYEEQRRFYTFFRGALLGVGLLLCGALLALYGLKRGRDALAAAGFAVAAFLFMLLEAGHLAPALASLGIPGLTPDTGRAVVETLMAASLLACLATGSDLRRAAPVLAQMLLVAAAVVLAFVVVGFVQPLLTAGLVRAIFGLTAALGFTAAVVLVQRGEPEAEAGLFTWFAALLWTFLALAAALAGGASALLSGLVLAGLAAVMLAMIVTHARRTLAQGYLTPQLFPDAGRRALALAGARASVWDWRADTGHLHLSDDFEALLGLRPGALAESGIDGFLELMHPVDRAAYLAAVDVAERAGNGTIDCSFRLRQADSAYRWFELRACAMEGPGRRAQRCIGTLTDVTSSKISEERLLSDAVYDAVTGLPNRALFLDRLSRAAATAVPGDPDGLYVLLLDIDRFKTLNEALGHEQGDALLTILGRRLAAEMAPSDSVARMPGDQFAVLYAGPASRDIATFADALRSAVARPVVLDGQEVFLTASIGVAHYRAAGLSGEQMLKDAAIALYEAKRRGVDAIEVFDPSMRDNRAELVVLESELRRAIERNEIEVHYQPIARLADMELAGFEALVRWRHPTLGLLAPESFISLAEHTGMIRDIGLAVLDEAAHQLAIWQRTFLPGEPLFMAVNISSAQLLETELVDEVKAILHREGVPRDGLKIEVTESMVMQNPERTGQILERIRELGVSLACDDFGTGYSSLSTLRKLPFDTLKVDKSFIAPDAADARAAVILEAVITMSHGLGLSIVAEGIENQAQVDRLGSLGCDFGQGYFIGRGMTARQVSDALAGLPIALRHGRTAITWLWERAAADPAPEPQPAELSAEMIAETRARAADARRDRDRLLAERLNAERRAIKRPSVATPPPVTGTRLERLPQQEIVVPKFSARKPAAETVPPVPEASPPQETPSPSPPSVKSEAATPTVPDHPSPEEAKPATVEPVQEAAEPLAPEPQVAAPADPPAAPPVLKVATPVAAISQPKRAKRARSRRRGGGAGEPPAIKPH